PFGEPSASPAISVATPSPLADQLKTEIGPGEAPTTEPVPDVAPPADRATEKFSAAPPESPSPQTPEPQAEATLGGRLLQVLRRQPEPLFALLDATKQRQVLELLRSSGDEYQSLYEGEAFAAVAPYLVRLPVQSNFLLTMVRDGWGRDWGVFLTCSLPLTDLRSYFRQALMIKTADGQEFFSRFYAPSFFRGFLSGCTPAEADRFFGPVRRYLMEAERPETLLEFTKTAQGVEMKKLPV
ncbi:MAG TPA: DUF4123 domain-containing protein, partial [Pyrinomonadaceae bacterium]|nr:DUF4123 domain-containing protein [Pyrinomonadaceae bacterium]